MLEKWTKGEDKNQSHCCTNHKLKYTLGKNVLLKSSLISKIDRNSAGEPQTRRSHRLANKLSAHTRLQDGISI